METVTNIAHAASKAIWGEQPSTTQSNETAGTEPLSGVKGAGDLNEPFDKGNETTASNIVDPTSNTTSLPDRTLDKLNPTTSNTFGSSNTHDSDPSGPHDSHLANKADPRIDSDHAGSYGNTSIGGLIGSTGGGLTSNIHSGDTGSGLTGDSTGEDLTRNSTGGGLTSNIHSSDTDSGLTGNSTGEGLTGNSTGGGLTSNIHSSHTGSGLSGNSTGGDLTGDSTGEDLTRNSTGGGLTSNIHSSHTDSGLSGNSTGEGLTGNFTEGGLTDNSTGEGLTGNTQSSYTSGGLTGNNDTFGSDPSGPHSTFTANKLDPRVDSDQSGSFNNTTGGGLTGNTHLSNTSGGLLGNTHSHGSDASGPHDSYLSNKADPLVDSDRIGSQDNVGTHSAYTTHNDTPSSIPTNPISGSDRGIHSHEETDKTGVIGGHSDPFKTSQNTASESKSNTGAPSSGTVLVDQQGAANPTDEPITGHQKSAVKESKEEAEDFLRTKDPNDHSGEPMHMHGGGGDVSAVPRTQEERRESKLGNPGGQEHGRETAEGTGEQWVKTTGMAADGGDFDATKPGAGREADRLMEQKGIHKTTPGKPSEPLAETSTHGSHGSHGSHDTEGKEKVPLSQKIKEKLHIGHKH